MLLRSFIHIDNQQRVNKKLTLLSINYQLFYTLVSIFALSICLVYIALPKKQRQIDRFFDNFCNYTKIVKKLSLL